MSIYAEIDTYMHYFKSDSKFTCVPDKNSKKTFSTAVFILTLIVVGIFLGSASKASAAISDWQRGASIQPTSPTQFGSAAFDQSLLNLKADNANYVNLVIPVYQDNIRSSLISAGGDTPTDASLISAINFAHSIGLKVSLKPHIETRDQQWRANIDPTDRTAWFANYGSYLLHYATLGQTYGADQLIIGTELVDLSSDSFNAQNTPAWRSLIGKVRAVYSGSLLYAANWGPLGTSLDEKNNIKFWDLLDAVGIDTYYPLGSDYSNNSVETLRAYWASIDQNDLQVFENKVNKPIIFTEIGYQSKNGAHTDPGNYQLPGSVNLTEQANAYQALFQYWNDKSYIKGLHLWNWDGNPNAGGINDTDYTPQGKLAEAVLKQWYGTTGTVTYPVIALPVAPIITASASFQSSSSAQIQLGTSVSFNSVVTNSGGPASGLIVDTEIYDQSGNKVFQNFSSNQNVAASSSVSYPLSWTPNSVGTYTIKVGVFSSDWSKNYIWAGNAGQFTATAGAPVSPATFNVQLSSSTLSAFINQSVTIPVSVTDAGAAASNILFDFEVYDQNNNKVVQKVFESQNFYANEQKTFSPSLTPTAVGTYTIKYGVFNNDWSKNYLWNDTAGKIIVSNIIIPPVIVVPPIATTTPATSTTPVVVVPPAATSTTPVATTTPPVATSTCPTSISINSFTGCYYNSADLTNFVLSRNESALNFDWGGGSPDSKINSENFSASWVGSFTFNNAEYTFNTFTDDGVRLYIDNQLVLDKWYDQVASYQVKQVMTSGSHVIKIEYYDHSGGARASINWSQTGATIIPPVVIPPVIITPPATSTPPIITPPATTTVPVATSTIATSTQPVATSTTPVATTTVPVVTPPVITPPVVVPAPSYSMNIWWPTEGATVSGNLPLKVLVDNLDVSKYAMYWQVDGGTLNLMSDNYSDYQHKESQIDVSGWNWKTVPIYTVNFVAKDSTGTLLVQKSTNITVVH